MVLMTNANGANMLFHITTQYQENYGDTNIPYWKFKGGDEYLIEVPGFDYDDEMSFKKGQMIVDSLYSVLEHDGEYTKEHVIGWGFVPDDFQTSFELDQLELDGEIKYPAKRMNYDELMEQNNV